MLPLQDPTGREEMQSPLGLNYSTESRHNSLLNARFPSILPLHGWVCENVMLLMLSSVLLFKVLSVGWVGRTAPSQQKGKDPPQLPHSIPVIGNAIAYLSGATRLANSIT